jgi:hypothetical protein
LFISDELSTLPNSNNLIGDGIKSEQLGEIQSDVADIKDWPAFIQIYKGYFPARNAFDSNGLALN